MDTFAQYSELALRTAKRVDFNFDLTHVAFGFAGEAGEFVDAVKKHTVYGKPIDRANLIEEAGDLLWYIALACETLGVDMAEVARVNVDKLRLRYPDTYSDTLAARRLDKEVA